MPGIDTDLFPGTRLSVDCAGFRALLAPPEAQTGAAGAAALGVPRAASGALRDPGCPWPALLVKGIPGDAADPQRPFLESLVHQHQRVWSSPDSVSPDSPGRRRSSEECPQGEKSIM